MWFLILLLAAIVLLVGYVVRRDRRRWRTRRATGSGEGDAAAHSAQISRGAGDLGGF